MVKTDTQVRKLDAQVGVILFRNVYHYIVGEDDGPRIAMNGFIRNECSDKIDQVTGLTKEMLCETNPQKKYEKKLHFRCRRHLFDFRC